MEGVQTALNHSALDLWPTLIHTAKDTKLPVLLDQKGCDDPDNKFIAIRLKGASLPISPLFLNRSG
ncbi:MAG: hypothetical protein Q8K75_04680 [Chlamydiales bacterium]|nr:hypothetical protein [Chlamydiales bacterium]